MIIILAAFFSALNWAKQEYPARQSRNQRFMIGSAGLGCCCYRASPRTPRTTRRKASCDKKISARSTTGRTDHAPRRNQTKAAVKSRKCALVSMPTFLGHRVDRHPSTDLATEPIISVYSFLGTTAGIGCFAKPIWKRFPPSFVP